MTDRKTHWSPAMTKPLRVDRPACRAARRIATQSRAIAFLAALLPLATLAASPPSAPAPAIVYFNTPQVYGPDNVLAVVLSGGLYSPCQIVAGPASARAGDGNLVAGGCGRAGRGGKHEPTPRQTICSARSVRARRSKRLLITRQR